MKFHKIKSFAKINLTLKILNKYSNGYHKIESLISKINLADEILIKEIQGSKNRISFSGKFSSNISNTNTCLLYTSPSPRDATLSRMPSSA